MGGPDCDFGAITHDLRLFIAAHVYLGMGVVFAEGIERLLKGCVHMSSKISGKLGLFLLVFSVVWYLIKLIIDHLYEYEIIFIYSCYRFNNQLLSRNNMYKLIKVGRSTQTYKYIHAYINKYTTRKFLTNGLN